MPAIIPFPFTPIRRPGRLRIVYPLGRGDETLARARIVIPCISPEQAAAAAWELLASGRRCHVEILCPDGPGDEEALML